MSIVSSGIVTIADGVTSTNLEVIKEGKLLVLDEGQAQDVTLADGGEAIVSSSGILYICTVLSGGTATVHDCGYAQDITVEKDGTFLMSSGGTVHHTIIKDGGTMTLYEDATVTSAVVLDGGQANVSTSGYAYKPTISQGGTMRILRDGKAEGGQACGLLEVQSGGTATSVKVMEGGEISVLSEGYVNLIGVSSRGSLVLLNGGLGFKNSVYDEGYVCISSGGNLISTTVKGGCLDIKSYGQAGMVKMISGGTLHVSGGGTATHVTWTPCEGIVEIDDGATVTFASQYSGVYYGSNNMLKSNQTVIESQTLGTLETMCVMSGGTAVDTTVSSGGRLDVFSGGILAGVQTFEEDAAVSMCEGAVLDFDLTRTEGGIVTLVNDWSVIRGTPTCTLTVDEATEKGVYSLANGAVEFNIVISVLNVSGEVLGALSIGDTLTIGNEEFTLNVTGSTLTLTVKTNEIIPTNLVGKKDRVSWDSTGAEQYVVEYSTDNFKHAIQVFTSGTAVDLLDLPAGTYQWRVKAADSETWAVGEDIVSVNPSDTPQVLQSNADGNKDVFFATANGSWGEEGIMFLAFHVGSVNDWEGTHEVVMANDKGRIQNLFFGSSDPNVLCLTDADNGDAIFVDNVYTDLPDGIAMQQSRLFKIQEIRAGSGDDIVDMTSQQFEYTGDGLTIRGGDGDDVIWANKGDNLLFGDAGDDRIVGASGNDVIAGGIGNDRLHGGGGKDVFTFCDNWGTDEVKQLASGSVTLWFANGDQSNWNDVTLTYTDGTNSVTVLGVTAEQVTLKFGDDGSDQFASLSGMGAFADFTSQRIYEESGKGLLASL